MLGNILHAEYKSSQATELSISIHTWQQQRKPPHAIMAGNLIFKLEIICPGMEDGHHNHLPSKPQTARDGCREGKEGIIILFLLSKPYHSLIFPHISGCQCKGAALFFFFSLSEEKTERKARQLNPAWNRALIAAPRWVPKPPNRMLLCIISKAQLSMYINEKHCCATNLSGLVLAEFLGWKSQSSHNWSVHPAA